EVVADEPEAGQATVLLRAAEAHPVVVVPQGGRALVVRVDVGAGAGDHAAHGVRGVGGDHRVGRPVTPGGEDEVGRVAVVFRGHHRAVQVHHGRYGQLVVVGDDDPPAPPGLDRRPGKGAFVPPDRGLHVGEDALHAQIGRAHV